jgi:hypothetical protein
MCCWFLCWTFAPVNVLKVDDVSETYGAWIFSVETGRVSKCGPDYGDSVCLWNVSNIARIQTVQRLEKGIKTRSETL